MPFTSPELTNIANSALDFFMNRGDTFMQTIQQKPLLDAMEKGSKTFPGGKGDISIAVQFDFGDGTANSNVRGFTHDDTVTFFTPANVRRAAYPWREHHIGLTLTHTELKIDGLSVADSAIGENTTAHSKREMTVLVNLLENKLADFAERYARSMNELLWGDGTGDAKALAGIRAAIVANPTTGTYGGINRATTTGWRNRARTAAHAAAGGTGAITSSPANGGALLQTLQAEKRQLRRYGGNPTKFLCGSDFLGAMETEMRANGLYSQSGFRGKQDGAMGALQFDGTDIVYDPTLDDLGLAKRAYWWDPKHIYLMAMEDEWRRQHSPARPFNQFALYRSVTSTGQLVAQQMNSALVIDIV